MSEMDHLRDHRHNDDHMPETSRSLADRDKDVELLPIDQNAFEEIEKDFQQFLQEIIGDRNLEKFRLEYERLQKILKTSYENEKKLISKCKELNDQIYQNATSVKVAIAATKNEVDRISNLKQKVDDAWKEVEKHKEEEIRLKNYLQRLKIELAQLARMLEQASSAGLDEDKQLKELLKEIEEKSKEKETHIERLAALATKNSDLTRRIVEEEKEIAKFEEETQRMDNMTKSTKADISNKEVTKDGLSQKTNELREKIAEDKNTKEVKLQELEKLKLDTKALKVDLDNQDEDIRKSKEEVRGLENTYVEWVKRIDIDNKNKIYMLGQTGTQEAFKADIEKEVKDLEKQNKKQSKQSNILLKKNEELKKERDENEAKKEHLKTILTTLDYQHDMMRRRVEDDKKTIEDKMRQRDLLNKDVVKGEERIRIQLELLQTHINQLKKLENKIQGYKTEAQKLNKLIHQLDKDKDKYGIEASQANAKYYQCLEQVKMKNNLITKLQKKNIEAEAKLKQQQNLYEAVRSDRNLYAKNLREAQEEISELKKKFKRMTHQINQLKDEIAAKDESLTHEHFDNNKINQENEKLKADIERFDRNIENAEEMIRTQENDIARLKFVISEAETEKQKQKKDYDMVINERDILGTQLIRRNDELALLYEKIKIQQSTLAKGEIYYQERLADLKMLKKEIAEIKREIDISKSEIECIGDLKKEVFMLEKELLDESQNAKALTEELQKPMNVHRWRKLEGTDPETYDMIQKIHSLQKRLIAKSEEVSEKDMLIQEKEKLYVELKNILAKQSGPEVAEKLQAYQQNLKDRAKQLKEMVNELKNYQSQVSAYNFENERLDKQIRDVKNQYLNQRRKEAFGMENSHIILEEDEPPGFDDGVHSINRGDSNRGIDSLRKGNDLRIDGGNAQ